MAGVEPMDTKEAQHPYQYDLIVIGGGSGGLAAAKEAAILGAKVALFDFVKPTPIGTKWGLGGTCVNVGCIPKKIMHYSALLGASHFDALRLGWDMQIEGHKWETLKTTVKEYIQSLNFGYRKELRSKQVEYINAYASFVDPHTVQYTVKKGKTEEQKITTAQYFILAVGGRPKYPNIPGAVEHCITSDDIFSLNRAPGKTLCVGAGYISLECAGFLSELKYETSVMVRSELLRGFDRQSVSKIEQYMEGCGVRFIRKAVPTRFEKLESGKILVTYEQKDGESKEFQEEFDTVLLAMGRTAQTATLGLEAAGVEWDRADGKIRCRQEQTNVPHIYAIGDVVYGALELTPVAIQAGRLLARRLYSGSQVMMDYHLIPTTVFTPIEYGTIGYSEEEAEAKFGADNLEIYLSEYNTLELGAVHRQNHRGETLETPCLVKLICLIPENERVIGFHVVSPHAGEITQGVAIAMRCGATKQHFDATVGIHPTSAEEFTTLRVTKRSGESAAKGSC
eukprot:TRINITY_DN1351_c0_g1_i6.p1 TRINITY_DN1351_c0_g1~~TRINITY_DN1351_c0_g1_i6.p1  ORF type:complete len:509 (+),score=165.64 TRINITY_DN1351_c0_g1_i6:73-1599(+)